MTKNPLARLLAKPSAADQLRALRIRDDLVRAVEKTAFGRQTDRDLVALAALLDEDEVVLRLLEGRGARGPGLLVLTTRRLLFLPRGAGEPMSLSTDDVQAASSSVHRGMGRLVITSPLGDFIVDQILGVQADWMRDDLNRPQPSSASASGTADPDTSPVDPLTELAQLRALHDGGLLDDTEYDIRKRRAFRRL